MVNPADSGTDYSTVWRANLSNIIRKYRQINNLSQNDLANKVNISQSHIGSIETKRNRVSADTLFLLAKELGFSLDALLDENPVFTREARNCMERILRASSPEKIEIILATLETLSDKLNEKDNI